MGRAGCGDVGGREGRGSGKWELDLFMAVGLAVSAPLRDDGLDVRLRVTPGEVHAHLQTKSAEWRTGHRCALPPHLGLRPVRESCAMYLERRDAPACV